MLKTIFFLIPISISIGAFAQDGGTANNKDEIKKCGQTEALERMKIEDPIRFQIYQQSRVGLEQETESVVQKSGTVYTIPVVFHILHNNGPENISDEQIQDALNILNRDFRKLNPDVNSVYTTFQPIASDVEIEFEFAKTAPNGVCFEGITRTESFLTNNGENGLAQFNAIVAGNDVYQGIWPHHKYLNIYVCKDLGTAAGYTYTPNGYASIDPIDMRYNSIFMKHDYVGSIGTGSVFGSRVLTHETGHWLNLSHIWGGDYVGQTCGDDYVADTPITKGFNYCPSSPNNAKVCNPNIVENYENYMDYSFCAKMFTQGQTNRMRAAIVSPVGGRDNIWTEANLEEVGVTGNPVPLCAAKIEADATLLCEGSSVAFSLTGLSESITSYAWIFQGGSPATSTQANPTVTYSNSGTYDVSLSITTASESAEIINTSYIHIDAPATLIALPLSEGFVNYSFPPIDGWSINNGGNSVTWQRTNKGTAPTPGSSATLNFDPGENTLGNIDDLNTPAFSLSEFTTATLTFDVAYKPYSTSFYDKLEVLISSACGVPFEVVYAKEGTVLQTESEGYGYPNPTVWRNESVDLTPYIGNTEVKVKFRGISGWGNQVYLDNINISGSPVASFNASTTLLCEGETVTYTNSSIGATSWNWNFGEDAIPAVATGAGPHEVTYTNSGSKTVVLSLNGGVTSTSQTVLVNSLPSVALADFETFCVYHVPIPLTQGSPAGGIYTGIGVNENQFNPSIAGIGTHTITYTYTDSTTNCTNSADKEITVDGCLGIDNDAAYSFKIFPNPTRGVVTVSSSHLINEIVVFDNEGRVVFKLNPENLSVVDMNLSTLSAGIYLVQTDLGATLKSSKIVVE